MLNLEGENARHVGIHVNVCNTSTLVPKNSQRSIEYRGEWIDFIRVFSVCLKIALDDVSIGVYFSTVTTSGVC
jgi:hypothetical protein